MRTEMGTEYERRITQVEGRVDAIEDRLKEMADEAKQQTHEIARTNRLLDEMNGGVKTVKWVITITLPFMVVLFSIIVAHIIR